MWSIIFKQQTNRQLNIGRIYISEEVNSYVCYSAVSRAWYLTMVAIVGNLEPLPKKKMKANKLSFLSHSRVPCQSWGRGSIFSPSSTCSFLFPSSSSLASLVFRLRTPFVAHSPSVSFMSRQHWNPPFAMVVVTRHIVEDLGGINTRTVPSLWRKDTLLLGDLQWVNIGTINTIYKPMLSMYVINRWQRSWNNEMTKTYSFLDVIIAKQIFV